MYMQTECYNLADNCITQAGTGCKYVSFILLQTFKYNINHRSSTVNSS